MTPSERIALLRKALAPFVDPIRVVSVDTRPVATIHVEVFCKERDFALSALEATKEQP